jgi:predicted MFS family arabinose efflux permease
MTTPRLPGPSASTVAHRAPSAAPEAAAPSAAAAVAGLPWRSLLVLALATFVMVTAEMLPTAVLRPMSAGLGVSEASTGVLVSLWAGAVVVASFPLVRLTARRDRRAVVAAALVALAVSAAATGLAPTYEVAVGARLVGAAAVGLLWATANAYTADLVPDALLGRGVAVVLGGATLGMVLGTPLANLVAQVAGWRAAFAGLAVATLAVAVLVRTVLAPAVPAAAPAAVAPAGAGPGAWPMLALTVAVGVLLVGHYGAYTFVTRLVEAPARELPGGASGLLLLCGVASAVGVAVVGRFGARTTAALAVSGGATAVALLALGVVDVHPLLGAAVVALWGLASGTVPPVAQTAILRLGGPARRATAGALIPVVFNGGIAVGAALAAALVAGVGVSALPGPAAGVVLVATVAATVVAARPRAAQQGGATGSPVPVRR